MKNILVIFLLAGVTFALFPQAAGTEPKDSQPIVVTNDKEQPAQAKEVKTVITTKGYTTTTTVPETTTTVQTPEKTLERDGRPMWIALGLRSAIDYHLTPKDGAMSAFWFYGEIYNQVWGIQGGIAYLNMPITTYLDTQGTTFTGTGTRNYLSLDLLGKYYFWFMRTLWVGAGVNYAALMSGQIKWYYTGQGNNGTNPTDATTAAATSNPARWTDVNSGGGIFYVQGGVGLKMPIGHGLSGLNFEPEFRFLVPLNAPSGYGTILRFNIGISYAFGM